MTIPWSPPVSGVWNPLNLDKRQEQALPLSTPQGDDNKTNAENALNWLADRVMGLTYVNGFSLVVNPVATVGNVSVVTASTNHSVLRRNGSTLDFGAIDLEQSGAVGVSVLKLTNGGTGLNSIGAPNEYLRVNAFGSGLEYAPISFSGYVPYVDANQDLDMGEYSVFATSLTVNGLTPLRIVATNASNALESITGTGFIKVTAGVISYDSSTYFTNPMTTLGDLMYGGASGSPTRLAGNITTARFFLTSTGVAGLATAPAFFNLFGTINAWSAAQTIEGIEISSSGITQNTGISIYKTNTQSGYNRIIGGTTANVDSTITMYGSLSGVPNAITYDANDHRIRTIAGVNLATYTPTAATVSVPLTLSTMTSGSVVFAGTSGLLSQDNNKFRYLPTGYNSNAMLMVNATAGSPTPLASLHVRGSGATISTDSFFVERSDGTILSRHRNDGVLVVGNTNTTATLSGKLHIFQGANGGSNGITFSRGTANANALYVGAGTTDSDIQIGFNASFVEFSGGLIRNNSATRSLGAVSIAINVVNSTTGYDFLGSYTNVLSDVASGVRSFAGFTDQSTHILSTAQANTLSGLGSFVSLRTYTISGTFANDMFNVGLFPIINQTGASATGVFRSILSNPTLTSAYNYKGFTFTHTAAYAPNAAITNYSFSDILPITNASANSQTINGLTIGLTGSNGAFTGVIRNALTLTGGTLQLATVAGDYAAANGAIWYNSSTNKFRGRENGVTIDLSGGASLYTTDGTLTSSRTVTTAGNNYKIASIGVNDFFQYSSTGLLFATTSTNLADFSFTSSNVSSTGVINMSVSNNVLDAITLRSYSSSYSTVNSSYDFARSVALVFGNIGGAGNIVYNNSLSIWWGSASTNRTVQMESGGLWRFTHPTRGAVLSNISTANIGSGTNGELYYDTTLNKLRGLENGAWVNLGGAGGGGVTAEEAIGYSLIFG